MQPLSIAKKTLADLPPCALIYLKGYVLIGTYKLEEESGRRHGSLDVYTPDLVKVLSVTTKSAILDLRSANDRVYTAHSTGEVLVWSFEDGRPEQIQEIMIDSEENLVLQIAVQDTLLAATLSTGEVCVWDLSSATELWRVQSHSLEAWCCSFTENCLYSGGDDMLFFCHDLRTGTAQWRLRHHDAGVTSILPRGDDCLWTGGYDDHLRILDPRLRRQLDYTNLGGGVWRLIPEGPENQIIACCMYGGLRTLKPVNEVHGLPTITGTLDNHESMVYGADWGEKQAFSCSFYDKLVQSWEPNLS